MTKVGTSWRKAALTGMAIAAVPLIGLNIVLGANLLTGAQREADDVAREVLAVVTSRLDNAATALASLQLKNVQGCADAARDALQAAATRAGAVIEVAVVDPQGAAVCSSNGVARVIRRISPEHGALSPELSISVAAFGTTGQRPMIQLIWRKSPGGIGYRALFSGDDVVPFMLKSRLTPGFTMELVSIDGASVLRKNLGSPAEVLSETALPSVAATATTERYPLRIDVVVPGAALIEANSALFVYANIGGLMFGFLVVVVLVLATRRGGGPVREIADGIRNGEFIPYYQPVINIVTGRLAGCEVLMRWRRADGTVLAPGRFIALAEASGEIFPMTLAIMEAARDELGEAYARAPHLEVGFNLCAGHFDDTAIVDDVKRIFEGSSIRMSQLMFEVTERQALQDITRARLVIAKLQALGARVALDDVGTGHGGLSYLLKLGVDVMKMDKMFVDAIGTERYSIAIVDSLVKLADDMNLDLIAEGVESFEQLQYLRDKGVRKAQGYIFAPPLPASSFLRLVRAMSALPDEPERKASTAYVGPIRMAGAA